MHTDMSVNMHIGTADTNAAMPKRTGVLDSVDAVAEAAALLLEGAVLVFKRSLSARRARVGASSHDVADADEDEFEPVGPEIAAVDDGSD